MHFITTPFRDNHTAWLFKQPCQKLLPVKSGISVRTNIYALLVTVLSGSALTAGAKSSECPTASFAPVVTYASGGTTTFSVAVGDFNGDGKADLVTANSGSNNVGVLFNLGGGAFGPATTYPSGGSGPYSVAVGDFNGDNKADLVVTNYSSGTIGVLLNNGSGGFFPAATYSSGGESPASVVAGDFNGDGKNDLAVVNYSSATVGVLLNNGSGAFNPVSIYSSGGSGPTAVIVGDFNGDSKTDLAIANYYSNAVGILLNNGSGAFAPAVSYPSGGENTTAVAAGDFNGDGKTDLAASHFNSGNIGVLLNNGSGAFAPALPYALSGSGPYGLVPGDFNGDGKTDLAAANYSSTNVDVILNNGSGTFAAAVSYPSGGSSPYSIAVADFDSNGNPDLVVANHTSSNVGVLLNTCNPCAAVTVSIPDAIALPSGVQPNTVYPGYAPASSITLTANVSGGTEPYSFTWSTGSHDPSITVSPAAATTYTVSVTDANGCLSNTASLTIHVSDVSSGKKGDKVLVCHKPGKLNHTLSISADDVADHLGHGDLLGSCDNNAAATTVVSPSIGNEALLTKNISAPFSVKALSNPSSGYFILNLKGGDLLQRVHLRVVDTYGRLIERKDNLTGNQTLRIGALYHPGIYFAEVQQGKQKTVIKLVKQ
jgi:hypothetical protein